MRKCSLFLLVAYFFAPLKAEHSSTPELFDVLVRLDSDPAKSNRPTGSSFASKVGATVESRRNATAMSQRRILHVLAERGIPARPYWIVDAIHVQATKEDIDWLSAQPEIREIVPNHVLRQSEPQPLPIARVKQDSSVTSGVQQIHAPEVWAMGFLGQGVVIANQDSGIEWEHPALRAAYRGWDGAKADHKYQWHDAITSGNHDKCELSSLVPCDDNGHGTHTMGTMVGDDGLDNKIGVAPDARWIGCRNMNQGVGSVATYLDCFQWLLAPTNLDGGNPTPALAPHIINNSWGCPPSEGCAEVGLLEEAVDTAYSAGIFVVAAAGNSGDSCSSISTPPAIYQHAFTVGATDPVGIIAPFSSRGPVNIDGSERLKPDVTAPGVWIRSAYLEGSYIHMGGTSMAGPHVAGIAALMMSANPALIGNPARVAQLIRKTAVPAFAPQDCGAWSGQKIPNAACGYGRLDGLAAVVAAIENSFDDSFED